MMKSGEALWNPARVAREITDGAIFRVLGEEARTALSALDAIPSRVVTALTDPKPLDISMPVLDAVLAAQYYEVFEALQPPRRMTVFEPCVGASCPVILAMEAYTGGEASYTTINLNRKLRDQLQVKIAHLKSEIRIVEDNAQNVSQYLGPGSVDVACFHHAVNDILQTAVSEPRGMDTTAVDWFPNERQMIEWLAEDAQEGRIEVRGKPELMQIVGDVARLVKPGGYMVFDHFNWCRFIGVDWFPWELFYNLIPMTRAWIKESGLAVSEVELEGVNRQWWMVLRVD
ncbi:MAG: hypothetical protein K1Y02_16725 [Candidatus Hydrogenedentes bacterium]|nr:hypothetical protein [Candidatus Hydrogenedentota bacterium]